ncbi:MAG: condensation domain-containing protein [Jatrophihabitantaceae bacterium]
MTISNAGIRPATATPVDAGLAGTAPLTFGQLAAWRDASRLPRQRWHEANVFNTFTLPRPVPASSLSQAVTQLEAKHESLRTCYDLSDPLQPRQRLLPARTSVEVPVIGSVAAAEVARLIEQLIGQPFDLSRDRPMRVLAITDNQASTIEDGDPQVDRVLLCLHHIACDGWSIGLLWTDLLALLGIEGEPLPVAPISLYALAEQQRTASSWQQKVRASQRHFRAVYLSEVADFRDRDADAGVLQVALESDELARSVTMLAGQHQVSVATVFTAAFLEAVARFCTAGPIRIGLMTSNRFLQRWQHQVSTMNQLVPIVVAADPATDFGARLAATQLASMRAFRLGMFDVDAVTPAALDLAMQPGEVAPLCILNVVNGAITQYPLPVAGGAPQLHWEQAFNLTAARCNLRVLRTQQDTVLLRLRTGGLPAETAASILQGTYQRVIEGPSAEPAALPAQLRG